MGWTLHERADRNRTAEDMRTIAKLASPLNWSRRRDAADTTPRYFLFSDVSRLPDPGPALARLPRGAAVVLRHTDADALAALARRTVPRAHALGLRVLLAGDPRRALQLNCDGVHLCEARARRGPVRVSGLPPGFLITAAAHADSAGAHGQLALWRAACAGAQAVVLSPVFATQSHPGARALGAVRFARIARSSPRPVVALGGIGAANARRLRLGPARGLAAIGAWTA